MRTAVLVVLAACTHPIARPPDAPNDAHDDAERYFTIWLGGAQVGTAVETERWSSTGVVLRRTEALEFLRGDAPVALTTTIEIHASRALIHERVVERARVR